MQHDKKRTIFDTCFFLFFFTMIYNLRTLIGSEHLFLTPYPSAHQQVARHNIL